MPIRRNCDPIYIQRIWDAIKQFKGADTQKIAKYVQNVTFCSPVQAETYIKQALKDKLIISTKKNDSSQIFKICQQELPELDGKDWYCFECHRAGDVISCSNCFRVFHHNCICNARRKFESQKVTNNYPIPTVPQTDSQSVTIICDDSDEVIIEPAGQKTANDVAVCYEQNAPVNKRHLQYDENLCSVCNVNRIDYSCGLSKAELNYMLKFVLDRIRAWLPSRVTNSMAIEEKPEWMSDAELSWRASQLFFDHMDMSVIEVNLKTENYSLFSEFLADVYTIHHNVAIFHGIESQEFGAAEFVIRDALHDIAEMKTCVDCYKHSNEKMHQKWFCLPCRNPHQLVWAKQKGYPYWPAKVIKETETHYDVRFFGGKYERALLLKTFIRPIEYTAERLQVKNSAGLTKATEELKYHQLLLQNPAELEKLLASTKPKRRIISKPRNLVANSLTAGNNSGTPNKKTKSLLKTPNSVNKIAKRKPGRRKGFKDVLNTSESSLPSTFSTVRNGKAKEIPSRVISKRKSTSQIEVENKKKVVEDPSASSNAVSGNIIDISDGEDDFMEYSFRANSSQESFSFDDTFEQVTSSTENFSKQEGRTESGMLPLDQPYSDSVERMRRKLENMPEKKDIIKCAMDCMQLEIDKITNDHNEHLKRLFESHNQQISETKKKQWCYNCEQDAIYHCCWNTAYCSQTCQQHHWQAEHKKVCRRKRT